jgi:hypothetical protein
LADWIDRFKLLETRWIQCREVAEPGGVIVEREQNEDPSFVSEKPSNIFVTDPIAWSERRKRELGPG